MSRTKVINVRSKQAQRPYIYVGRPSAWGNPFKIGVDGSRREVIRKYEEWIKTQPELMLRITELKGRRLGCYCAPLPCHADVLARLADAS